MEIISKIRELAARPVEAAYQCWMCGEAHNDPVAYLWHIRACGQEVVSKPILAKQGQSVPAIMARQR